MEKRTSLVQHALKMHEHIVRLNQLGYWMDFELSVDLIMASLPDNFAQFVLDYRMNYIVSTIPELINVLKIVEGKWAEKNAKETTSKQTCFYCGQVGHWKRNCRPTWSRRRRWHMMHHHLQVFMSLRLIWFLLTTLRYVIPVVAHTYGLICRAKEQ